MMRLSDLKYALTVEEPVETPDGGGGVATGWQALAGHPVVFAAIEYGAGTEEMAMRQLQSMLACDITLRYRADITPRHRLTDDAFIYEILSIAPDAAAGYMVLTCRRRAGLI